MAKILLRRGDVNPHLSDEDGRTPLSYAAGSGHEGIVKILLRCGGVNPNSLGGMTPLSYAARPKREGLAKISPERGGIDLDSPDQDGLKLLSSTVLAEPISGMTPQLETRPFSHQISPNIGLAQNISAPAVSALEGGDLGLVSQRESIIPDTRHDITEVISPHSHKPPPNQPEATPSASVLMPTLTSKAAPDLAISQPSGPLKRRRATPPLLYPAKRPHPSSS